MNSKKLERLFPYINNISKLKIDDDSINYISIRDDANIITIIIQQHLNNFNLSSTNIVITDATAGVGGNTLSFANNFEYVNAIEINKLRCDYLRNNIDTYQYQKC